jgi:Fe2+ or Zn2+ uptake regulation protein
MTPNSRESAEKLRRLGVRLTQQRAALAGLLFGRGNRHVSAEELYSEAKDAHIRVSLATVYNTLNLFTTAGLLREVAIEGAKAYFTPTPPIIVTTIFRKRLGLWISSTPNSRSNACRPFPRVYASGVLT